MVTLKSGDRVLTLQGTVVSVDVGIGFGMEFRDLTPDQQRDLAEFLATL
jgi:hypothetical protein